MFRRWFQRHRAKSETNNGHYRHGNQTLIDLRRVVKTYESAAGTFTALTEVDLQVDPGEFVAVVGKSGSGKSTLINMIAGIDRPTAGEVLVGDTAVHTLNEGQIAKWRGRHLGVVFQFFQLLPTLTVVENIMLPMDFCHMYPSDEREERAMHLLEQVEMADHAHKLPTAISGGQQQRVAIARALANDPPVLLADEPTGNLDSQTADSVFQLFENLVEHGKTILMVTHDQDLTKRVTRAITVADGQIVDEQRRDAVGDELLLELDKRETKWQVVGLVRTTMSGPRMYVNYPYFARVIHNVGQASSVQIVTERHDFAATAEVAKALETHFEQIGLKVSAIETIAGERERIETVFNIIVGFLSIMAILLAVVGGLGLMGTMSINVLERIREIGVIRAIGASDGAVQQIVIVEGVLIGCLSWLVGVLIALPVSMLLSNVVGELILQDALTYTFSVSGALLWLGIVVLLATLASFLPARSASRLTVREVLAYE